MKIQLASRPQTVSVHPRYGGDTLSAAFVSDLSALMPQVDLWLHGHVHGGFENPLIDKNMLEEV